MRNLIAFSLYFFICLATSPLENRTVFTSENRLWIVEQEDLHNDGLSHSDFLGPATNNCDFALAAPLSQLFDGQE